MNLLLYRLVSFLELNTFITSMVVQTERQYTTWYRQKTPCWHSNVCRSHLARVAAAS